jgi:hypothetical protein
MLAALRELVDADDPGEDAGEMELDIMFASLHDNAMKLANLHEAKLEMESTHGLNVYASEAKLSRVLLFLTEQILAHNSDLCLRARRVGQTVEITIKDQRAEKQLANEAQSWKHQVSAIRRSAAENYIRTLGGTLRISESQCIIELPLSRQGKSQTNALRQDAVQ